MSVKSVQYSTNSNTSGSSASEKPKSKIGFGGVSVSGSSSPSISVHSHGSAAPSLNIATVSSPSSPTVHHKGSKISVPASSPSISVVAPSSPSVHNKVLKVSTPSTPSAPKTDAGAAFGVTLHKAPKKTKQEKKDFKVEWKLRAIKENKSCHACNTAFSPTKRPVCKLVFTLFLIFMYF